jgi:hypothetical protein
VFYFLNNFEICGPDFLSQIDTSLTGIEKYDPLSKDGSYFSHLGNVGHAANSLVFIPQFKTGFEYCRTTVFENYLFRNDSIKYYWVGKPFTQLSYVMGAKKEQNILVDHSQNVARWLNFGLTFRYTNSPGYYTNEKADDKNFVVKSRFQTRNYRYMVLMHYLHNKIQPEENGGIKYDTVFEQNIEQNRRNIEVNLQTAGNIIRENNYYVKQFFFIPGYNRFEKEDSLSSANVKKLNAGNISLSTIYSRMTQLYKQELSDNKGFYQNTFDSVHPTYDSVFVGRFENELSWTNADNAKARIMTFQFSFRHLYSEVKEDSLKTIIRQMIPTGFIDFRISKLFRLNFIADYEFGNAYSGDYSLKGLIVLHWKFGDLSYSLSNAMQEADRLMIHYSSNHFRWDNTFRKTSYVLNNFSYQFRTLKAGFNLFNIGSFVYFDTLAMPEQLADNMNVVAVYLKKLTNLGNWSLNVSGVYQRVSNSALRVPELAAKASFYYTNDLFKKVTILQAGIDVFYNTSYFGNAYMPATKSFYLQNRKKTGDYFYGDFFLNLQVKRARLFLKYVNLGFFLNDFRYYTVPSYPMQDGGFRFGVNWMFYD